MPRRHRAKSESTVKRADARTALDEQLKLLGEEYLEEQVPGALLDVLRRGMANRARQAEPREDSESDSDQAEPSGGQTGGRK